MSAVLAIDARYDPPLVANDNEALPASVIKMSVVGHNGLKPKSEPLSRLAASLYLIHNQIRALRAHDALGQVKSVINGRTIYNVYDSSGALIHVRKEAFGGDPLERSDYIRAGGKAIARAIRNGETYYTFSNHRCNLRLAERSATKIELTTFIFCVSINAKCTGSPVATMLDSTGVIERERYTPFGIAMDNPNVLTDQAGFTGHIKDSATGLNPCIFLSENCTLQARYYDPVMGRFLSVDPVTFMDTGNPNFFNRYAYSFNDPVNLIDPTGMAPDHIIDERAKAVADAVKEAEANVRDAHYSRNESNEAPATQAEAQSSELGFEQMSDAKSVFHRQGESGEGNSKFVSEDGKHEAVYDADGNLVTDDVNQGTYNFASPNANPVGHVILDVLPYYAYGNSPNDPTTFGERLKAGYKGDVNLTKADRQNTSGGGW